MSRITLAGCVILDEKGDVLLMHRNTPKRVQWELPGGKVEAGEEPEETAEREVAEELGISVRIVKRLGEQSFEEDGYEMDYIWFLAVISDGGAPTLQEEKFDALQYFGWEDLQKESQLSANTKNLVSAHMRKEIEL